MSPRAGVTRRFGFAAGHRYWVEAWSAEENERRFGRLTTPHGHNYALDVTIEGPVDTLTGMVTDLAALKRVVGETVVARFDHADLNADPLFKGRVPTLETIAEVVWTLLAPRLGPRGSRADGLTRLAAVRIWEDPTLWVDYRGPGRDAA